MSPLRVLSSPSTAEASRKTGVSDGFVYSELCKGVLAKNHRARSQGIDALSRRGDCVTDGRVR